MSRLLPYETIVKAHEGDPEAVDAVLSHYAGYIRYFSKMNGQVNAEVEDYVKERLIACLLKFQLCAQLRVCSQAGGIPVYPRFSQPDNSESWDDAGNGI